MAGSLRESTKSDERMTDCFSLVLPLFEMLFEVMASENVVYPIEKQVSLDESFPETSMSLV